MDGVFSAETWHSFNYRCRGRRPWLAVADEECESEPRTLQRGASNLYFPVIESALSIPPWSDALQEALGIYWNSIVNECPANRADFINSLARGDLAPILRVLRLSPTELASQIEERITRFNDDAILNIRQEEYRQFFFGIDIVHGRNKSEFEVRKMRVPESLRPFLSRVVRVVRLREVRALRGFTRINPPGDEDSTDVAALSVNRLDWLPAIEVRGEGIFLALNSDSLCAWESMNDVAERGKKIETAWRREWGKNYGTASSEQRITTRYLLTHTFAHALMRQLTLECGYSAASLRERLYVSEGEDGMAGLLIYTAASDSDGTLGGLQRQGHPERIERAVIASIRAMEWCSSDPFCIQKMTPGADGLSLAACHACVLAPETACEKFNRYLDRATLVGLPGKPKIGFFSALIQCT